MREGLLTGKLYQPVCMWVALFLGHWEQWVHVVLLA